MAENAQLHDSEEFNRRVANNTVVSMLSTIIYLATRVVVPPITLKYLGVETWGIWSFCFVITGYLGMGAFGITNVYIRYSAIFKSQGDTPSISRLISTGLALTLGGSGIVIFALYFAMPSIIAYFNISESNREMAFVLFYTTVITFLLQLTLSAFSCILQGLQRIAETKKAHIIATLTETVLIIVGLVAGLGIYALMLAFLVRNIIFVTLTYILAKRFVPDLRVSPAMVDRRILPYFWNYGGALQMNGLLNMFAGTLDRVLFLKFFGERAAGYLDIGQKFPRMAIFIPEAISGVIYPAVTHLQQGEHHDEIEKLYIRGCRYTNLIISTLMGFMAAFALQIMIVWLGPTTDLGLGPFLMVLYTLPFHGHVFTGPASAVFKGLGMPLLETRYPLLKMLGFAVIVGLTTLNAELTERSLAMAIAASIFFSTSAYVLYANKKLKIRQRPFFRKALLPGIIPYLLGFGMAYLSQSWFPNFSSSRIQLALVMLPIGLLFLTLTGVLFWLLVFDAQEKETILRVIQQKFKRGRPK